MASISSAILQAIFKSIRQKKRIQSWNELPDGSNLEKPVQACFLGCVIYILWREVICKTKIIPISLPNSWDLSQLLSPRTENSYSAAEGVGRPALPWLSFQISLLLGNTWWQGWLTHSGFLRARSHSESFTDISSLRPHKGPPSHVLLQSSFTDTGSEALRSWGIRPGHTASRHNS